MDKILESLLQATKLPPYYYILVAVPTVIIYLVSRYRFKSSQIMSIFGALMIFFTFTFICVFFYNDKETLQLTVYVHGQKGRQNIVLENTGQLVVDFDNDRRTAKIGENGRTNFGEIPPKFENKIIEIGLEVEGYQLANPNRRDTLNRRPIYLEVKKDNSLGIISGRVKARIGDFLVERALVMIGNDTSVVTNPLGIFKIFLPERMQVRDGKTPYHLTIVKNGYYTLSTLYYPNTDNNEIRLDKK
jgi:hypothetical protein